MHTPEGGEFAEMEANQPENGVVGAAPPRKVHSADHLAVEIPQTAHQISHGMMDFCFFLSYYVDFRCHILI